MTSINEIGTAALHSQIANPLQSSTFMGLARELRDHIYFYLVEPRRSLAELTSHPSDWFNPNVLLTNHQIRREVLEIVYEQKITVVVMPFEENNCLLWPKKVLERLNFKRCGIEVDPSGSNDEIDMWTGVYNVGFLKGTLMRSVFYGLVDQLNRMPGLEELHIWSPRCTVPTDEGLGQQKGDSEVDEESEMDMDDETGRYKDLAEDEAFSLEKLRQCDDAVFFESAISCFRPLADTINVTIEGNLSSKDSKRILSLVNGRDFTWSQVMPQGRKTRERAFAVDTTRASCESGGTRYISKVLTLSTVRVSLDGHAQKEIVDKESAAAIKEFVDGGFWKCWLSWR